MVYQTDERLKSYLDTNQLSREQMCRAILAIDRRFSDVRPRHPRGGPDGGRDIEATFRDERKAFGAVGFANQANDSDEQKKRIKQKFRDDAQSALNSGEEPEVFIFLTNINLTSGEKDELVDFAKKQGFKFSEVMDRERLRILLDSPDGFSIRFQYLNLPLSEEEQASFFSKWGDDINSIISTGFQKIETKLDRILFLQEASEVLSSLVISFHLNRIYDADEIGHFRVFNTLHLKEPKHNIFEILFGLCDRSNRIRSDLGDFRQQPSGIKHGISGGEWESHLIPENQNEQENQGNDDNSKYVHVGSSSGVGREKVEFVPIKYTHDYFIRIGPRLKLIDFDNAMFMPILNSSLASKLKAIHIYANGYKIQEINFSDFTIDSTDFDPEIPVQFTEDELKDTWVRIRPSSFASSFQISFSKQTPKRLFHSPPAPDSLENMRRKKHS